MEILETRIESGPDGLFHYGKFYFPQLKKGQGITLANSLRRVLLYDLPGFGITHARFTQNEDQGVGTKLNPAKHNLLEVPGGGFAGEGHQNIHEFSSIPGMRESIFEVLLNLRTIVFGLADPRTGKNKMSTEGQNAAPVELFTFSFKTLLDAQESSAGLWPRSPRTSASEIFVLRAKDLIQVSKNSSGLTMMDFNLNIVNPEQYLATIMCAHSPNFSLQYILNPTLATSGFWLPTDGNFFPVKRVNYSIEQNYDFTESVFLEIWTNGAIKPEQALDAGFNILFDLFKKAQSGGVTV